MTTSTEEAALLATIRREPGCDTARLVYADWLDDHAQDLRCQRCSGNGRVEMLEHCPACNGRGTTAPERAELIRVQVELAGKPGCLTPSVGAVIEGKPASCFMCRPRNKRGCLSWCENCCRREELMDRERELLTRHRADWLPKCPVCYAITGERVTTIHCIHCHGTGCIGEDGFRRGFVEVVRVPRMANVWERGNGLRDAGLVQYDGDTPGEWRLTSWAHRLRDGWPHVQEVWCGDREPYYIPDDDAPRPAPPPNEWGAIWFRDDDLATRWNVPSPVYERLERTRFPFAEFSAAVTPEDAARLALARGVARSLHGKGGAA